MEPAKSHKPAQRRSAMCSAADYRRPWAHDDNSATGRLAERLLVGEAAGWQTSGPWALTLLVARMDTDFVGSQRSSRWASRRQPWDPANGLRVGVFVGALYGTGLVAVTGFSSFWLVAIAGGAGGAVGFWTEKAKQSGSNGRLSSMGSSLVRFCLVLAFVAIGFSSVMPPAALPDDAPDTSFSATRALGHLEVIAREPHPMGSPAIREVREYLMAELEELSLEPVLQRITVPSYYDAGGSVDVVNVHATLEGTASTGTIVLVAHYDTFPTAPGANDNSAGVATLLETGRALLAGPPQANDVMLLFTDGEEPAPQFGASAFVDLSPAAADVALVVNFEANGSSGPSMLGEISGPEGAMVAQFAAAVTDPVAFSFISESLEVVGEVGTDFDPFRNAGVPGFNFAYLRGSPIYHTPADDLDSVNLDSLQHHGSNAVGLAQRYGNRDLGTMTEGNGRVYFTLPPFFVQYPAWLSAGAALLAAALVLRAVSEAHSGPTWAGVARRVMRAAGSVLVVVLATTGVWLLVTAVRSSPSVGESYLYLLCVVGAGALAVARLNPEPSASAERRPGGFSVIWVLLSLVTSFSVPGFSYLFVWPALAAALAHTGPMKVPGRAATPRFALVVGPTVILLVPAVEFFFQFGQPRPGNPDSSVPSVAAIAFLLAALASGLIREFFNRGPRRQRSSAPLVDAEARHEVD